MTLATARFEDFPAAAPRVITAAPPAAHVLQPGSVEEARQILELASEQRASVLVWGGGTHQGLGHRVYPDVVLATAALDQVIRWEPEDLTLVVEAGAKVGEVEAMLAGRRQTAGLPETSGEATVGGVVASGVSGYRRARLGPTRDRMLEVTLLTGDGRQVRGGGRVVKNVSGYDLPRLATGSMGALGVLTSVCLKLWPLPEASATVRIDDPSRAWNILYRPLAVLETDRGSFAYLQAAGPDVESQSRRLGGAIEDGLHWPDRPEGEVAISLRLPPRLVSPGVSRLPTGWRFVAQHGVGLVDAAGESADPGELAELRRWAEAEGGALVLTAAADSFYERFDPWGSLPPALALQRRLARAFDPMRIVNPGRLPGGI